MSASLGQGLPQRMTAFVDPRTGLMTPSWWMFLHNLWVRSGAANAPASIDDLAGEAGAAYLGGDSPDYAPDMSSVWPLGMDGGDVDNPGVDVSFSPLDGADALPTDDGSAGLVAALTGSDEPPTPLLFSVQTGVGSNYLSTQYPGIPTAAKGGNARGALALDIQINRSLATQVASGAGALCFGASNTGSGGTAVALGDSNIASGSTTLAVGFNNSASATNASAVGSTNTAGGQRSIAAGYLASITGTDAAVLGSIWNNTGNQTVGLGFKGDDRGNTGALVRSTVALGTTGVKYGRSQIEEYTFVGTTSGATALRLTTDGAAAGAANVAAVGTSFAASFTAEIVITDTTTNKSVTYSLGQSLIERQSTAASTTITLNAGGILAGPTSSVPFVLAAAPTITADTTNAGFNVSFTPPVGNTDTFYAICYLRLIVLRYN